VLSSSFHKKQLEGEDFTGIDHGEGVSRLRELAMPMAMAVLLTRTIARFSRPVVRDGIQL